MTDTELRELDAWIECNLFNRPDVRACNDFAGGIEWDSDKPIPRHYTTDPAAAMKVLEKVSFRKGVGVNHGADGLFEVCHVVTTPYGLRLIHIVSAETLPLAICKFAKEHLND